jgi:hypothetical protein
MKVFDQVATWASTSCADNSLKPNATKINIAARTAEMIESANGL